MNNLQINNIKNLQVNFDTIWNKFVALFPIVNIIINSEEKDNFKKLFAEKYENLCKANIDNITSSCLLERFVGCFNSSPLAEQFNSEVVEISNAVTKALKTTQGNNLLTNRINDIVRNMVLTIDVNPESKNNDYRNRLNEILVFNRLSECVDITVSDIEKALGNGKSCDFECQLVDGSVLLFEVLSINNLQVEKQDDSQTFSDFINQKIEKKFKDKTKKLSVLPEIKMIPVLEYVEGLEDFKISVNDDISISPLTVVKNTIDGINEISLGSLEEISEHIRNQKAK